MEKKYQIFISSTYKDLIEARSKVRDAILSMMHFPVGMEMFNAADEEQWEIIQETIDSSDYYVLILGQRYGSVIESGSDAGISYTEKEFRYSCVHNLADSMGLPLCRDVGVAQCFRIKLLGTHPVTRVVLQKGINHASLRVLLHEILLMGLQRFLHGRAERQLIIAAVVNRHGFCPKLVDIGARFFLIIQPPQVIREPFILDCQQPEEGRLSSTLPAYRTEHGFKFASRLEHPFDGSLHGFPAPFQQRFPALPYVVIAMYHPMQTVFRFSRCSGQNGNKKAVTKQTSSAFAFLEGHASRLCNG